MQPFRSPVFLSRLAIAGLALAGVCRILYFFAGIAMVFGPSKSFDLGEDQLSIWELVLGLIALIFIPIFLFTVVTFLMWLYRIFANLPAVRSDQTEFTPGWAVGWWFIPLANLIKPYQAVRTAWAESDPEVDLEQGFLTSVQPAAPGFMTIWWAFWIIGNITSNISNRIDPFSNPGIQSVAGAVAIFESLIWLVGSILAIKVVSNITERQEQRFARVGNQTLNAPPPPPKFDDVQH